MGFLQSGRGGQAVGRAVGPVRGQLWPKKRDWDPHGQEKQSKISFFLARQVGWAETAHL